jgi:glycosyltransferase involved in cell wall biosynthesis
MTAILVNAVSAKAGGFVTYVDKLIEQFRDRDVDVKLYVPESFVPPSGDLGRVKLVRAKAANYGATRRLIWEQTVWRQEIGFEKADVLFSAANFGVMRPPCGQLLMIQEGGLFNPFYLRNIMPTLGRQRRLETWLRRRMMMLSAANSQVILFPSETVRDWLLEFMPRLEPRCIVNPYGPSLEPLAAPTPSVWRRDGVLRMLFVSVYYPHKDPSTLVRATVALNRRGERAVARITMQEREFQPWACGPRDYRELTAPEVQPFIQLGQVAHSRIGEVNRDHDVIVFPSVSETFGFPLIEAMAMGRPVVAADTMINREICGPAALYFRPFDADALTNVLIELDHRPALREWLSAAGPERVRQRFNWGRHVDLLIDSLKRLAAGFS